MAIRRKKKHTGLNFNTAFPLEKARQKLSVQEWDRERMLEEGEYSPVGFTPYTPCPHNGTKCVFMIDGISVYGSKIDTINPTVLNDETFLLNCSDSTFTYEAPVRKTDLKYGMTKYMKRAHGQMDLAWPDRGAPNLPGVFWQDLFRSMRKATAKRGDTVVPRYTKLLICCLGSHGRTGTAMAAILTQHGIPVDEAVDLIRGSHCEKAIESQEQMEYLLRIEIGARTLWPSSRGYTYQRVGTPTGVHHYKATKGDN